MAKDITPVTKVRLRVPEGVKIEELISKLEISYEQVEPSSAEVNSNVCCVDVSVVSPVSTVSRS